MYKRQQRFEEAKKKVMEILQKVSLVALETKLETLSCETHISVPEQYRYEFYDFMSEIKTYPVLPSFTFEVGKGCFVRFLVYFD